MSLRGRQLDARRAARALPRINGGQGQFIQNRAVEDRSAGASSVTTAHEGCHALFECLELRKLFTQLCQVYARDIAQLRARPIRIVEKTHKLAHLVDGEAEIPATPNECEPADRARVIRAPSSVCARALWQQADLLVVADGRNGAASLLCQNTNRHRLHHHRNLQTVIVRQRPQQVQPACAWAFPTASSGMNFAKSHRALSAATCGAVMESSTPPACILRSNFRNAQQARSRSTIRLTSSAAFSS